MTPRNEMSGAAQADEGMMSEGNHGKERERGKEQARGENRMSGK
jgi:hypothetical protein